MLPDYPRRVCSNGGTPGCLDDVQHLYNTSAFLARGECRTYIGGAEANTVAMYGQMTLHPDTQVQYFDECLPQTQQSVRCVHREGVGPPEEPKRHAL